MRPVTILLVAALGAASLAGCSSAKKDEALATQIKSQMFSDPQVKAANVDVAVKDGEATLSGDVPNDAARYQAYKVASDTPGVKHVVDRMNVQSAELAPPPGEIPAEPQPVREHARSTKRHDKRSKAEFVAAESTRAEADPPPEPQYQAPAAAAPGPPPENVPEAPQPPPPPQPKRVEIPAGTSIRVQMIDGVDSAVNRAGETFHASLASPIVVDNQVVVPAGADMYVRLENAKSAGHLTGQSHLALELVRMEFQGTSYALATSEYEQTGDSRGKRTAETVGGGAVLGTLLGAVIGHGKGAAIGGIAGAGAGTAAEEATKAQQVKIPSETKLDFSLQQPVDVSYFPEKNRSSRP